MCVSTVYDDACRGDMRAECSLYCWLMCFRQATQWKPLHALNPWERGPQGPGRSERKYGRSSCVHSFMCGAGGWLCICGDGVKIPEQRGTFSDTISRMKDHDLSAFLLLHRRPFLVTVTQKNGLGDSVSHHQITCLCSPHKCHLSWI